MQAKLGFNLSVASPAFILMPRHHNHAYVDTHYFAHFFIKIALLNCDIFVQGGL